MSETLTPDQLAFGERLMQAATPGRWRAVKVAWPENSAVLVIDGTSTPIFRDGIGSGIATEADADLCEWLRNHAQSLLAAARWQQLGVGPMELLAERIAALEVDLAVTVKERDALRGQVATLDAACRQARACLLNLQSDEGTPIDRQMQKMVGELSAALASPAPATCDSCGSPLNGKGVPATVGGRSQRWCPACVARCD